MSLRSDDVREITTNAWGGITGLELQPVDAPRASDEPVAAHVCVSGPWTGAISLCLSRPLAARAAAAMFESDPGSVTPEELHDAVGELANVVGGGVKALLPGPGKLSTPTRGPLPAGSPPDVPLVEIGFDCEGEHLSIAVHARGGATLE